MARSSRGRLSAACILSLGSFGGCGSFQSSAIPEVPTWVHHPSHDIRVTYRTSVVAESRRDGEPYERGRPALDVPGRRVFIGSSDHGLYALRAGDGFALWRFETMGAVQSEPVYSAAEGAVYFGSNDGALYKVRADDGALLWRFASNAEVARKPELVGDVVYFVNGNDTVIAVDRTTGERIWSQHHTPALGMEVAGHAGVLVQDQRVFIAFSDGTVTAYDTTTGQEQWQPVDLSAEAEQALGNAPKYLDVDTTPVAVDIGGMPSIVVASYAAGITALGAETGGLVWTNPGVLGTTDLTLWEQPAHQDRKTGQRFPERRILIANTGTSGVWGLDPETGEEIWRQALPEGGVNKPAFISGAMLVTTSRQGIYLMSPLDGAVIDGIDTQVGFSMPATAYAERAFVLSNSGQFLALSVSTPR
jgi:outer membrane protein assembly factor BamB